MAYGIFAIFIFHIAGEITGLAFFCITVSFEVVIHIKVYVVPFHGDDVVFAVGDGIVGRSKIFLRKLLVALVGGVGPVVESTAEIAVLGAVLNTFGMPEFHDIQLAAAGPAIFAHIVAHHPVGGPEAVFGGGELDAGLNHAVTESGLVLRGNTAGGKALAAERFATRGEHEATFAGLGVGFHGHVLTLVILEFLVAAAIAVHLNVPDGFVEGIGVKFVGPSEGIAVGGGCDGLRQGATGEVAIMAAKICLLNFMV